MKQASNVTAVSKRAKPLKQMFAPNSKSLDQDFFMTGWFDNHPQSDSSLPETDDLKSFLGMTWPMSTSYFNPLNAVWLMQILDLRLLQSRPHWFVRDGLVPLLWFFKRYPKPPSFKITLLIDEELISFAPPAWSGHVGTYRIYSEVQAQSNSRTSVIGMSAETYVSATFTKHRLTEIVKKEEVAGIQTMDLFMPVRSWTHDEKEQVFHASVFREVFSIVPKQTRLMTRAELVGTFDIQKLRLYDLNEKLIVADNGLAGELLKKGAQWPDSRQPKANEDYRKISPSHGFIINWTRTSEAQENAVPSFQEVSRFHDQIGNVFSAQAFQAFPWPRWFADWAKLQVEAKAELREDRGNEGARESTSKKRPKTKPTSAPKNKSKSSRR